MLNLRDISILDFLSCIIHEVVVKAAEFPVGYALAEHLIHLFQSLTLALRNTKVYEEYRYK